MVTSIGASKPSESEVRAIMPEFTTEDAGISMNTVSETPASSCKSILVIGDDGIEGDDGEY